MGKQMHVGKCCSELGLPFSPYIERNMCRQSLRILSMSKSTKLGYPRCVYI